MAVISKNAAARKAAAEQSMAVGTEHVEPSQAEWADFEKRFKLSPRQLQLAKLLYGDCTAKLLMRRLGCARSTVGEHRAHLYAKLEVTDRTALVRRILEFCITRRTGGSLPRAIN